MIIVNVIIIIIKYYFVYFVFFKCKLPFLFRKYLKYNFHYMILFNTIRKLRCGGIFVIFRKKKKIQNSPMVHFISTVGHC